MIRKAPPIRLEIAFENSLNVVVVVVREGLAKALSFYYSFAGRLVEGPGRKLLVDCTSEGVLFVEADAEVELNRLGDAILPGSPVLEELLHGVPGSDGILGCPLLLLQVELAT
ncbi:hypothetical protein C3L33_21806, partial [Rhododendron williamsianum]